MGLEQQIKQQLDLLMSVVITLGCLNILLGILVVMLYRAAKMWQGKYIQLRRTKAIQETVDSMWLPTVDPDLYNKRVELINTVAQNYPKED